MPVETVGENVRVRVRAPGTFEDGSFRTITISADQGIKAVIGRPKGEKKTAIQSYMFDKKKWSEAEAEKWVADHKKELEEAVFGIEHKELSLVERLTATFKSWLEGNVFVNEPSVEPDEPQSNNAFTIWKEASGKYRWLAVFSNRYRDNDNPPEILSQAAHNEYVKAVDAGEWPMPQLWHWHTPGTAWGQADWLAYDEDNGFVLASGTVKAGHEHEAEALANVTQPIGVSHGMIGKTIQRDTDDPTVITHYRTFEISDLPAWAAANPLTGFSILDTQEASDMSIPKEKREYLTSVGLTGEQIDAVEEKVGNLSKEAEATGLEFKETPAEVIAPATEETVATEPEATPETQPAETPQNAEVLTKEEVAEAIVTATLPLRQMVEAQQARLDELQAKLDAREKSDEEKIAAKAVTTPAMSLAELVSGRMRAIGNPEARVDGREVAKAGPAETPPNPETRTGISFIDRLVASQGRK